jgi:hypothetical protein
VELLDFKNPSTGEVNRQRYGAQPTSRAGMKASPVSDINDQDKMIVNFFTEHQTVSTTVLLD